MGGGGRLGSRCINPYQVLPVDKSGTEGCSVYVVMYFLLFRSLSEKRTELSSLGSATM